MLKVAGSHHTRHKIWEMQVSVSIKLFFVILLLNLIIAKAKHSWNVLRFFTSVVLLEWRFDMDSSLHLPSHDTSIFKFVPSHSQCMNRQSHPNQTHIYAALFASRPIGSLISHFYVLTPGNKKRLNRRTMHIAFSFVLQGVLCAGCVCFCSHNKLEKKSIWINCRLLGSSVYDSNLQGCPV